MKRVTVSLAKLNKIADNITNLYQHTFASPEEQYRANKQAKEQIGQLIVQAKQEVGLPEAAQQQVVNEALQLLAKSTGCAEDEEIAEYVLDKLYLESRVIDQKDLKNYYEFKKGRWE